MAPTVSWRQGCQPRSPTMANGILTACQTAANDSGLAGFSTMTGRHTSRSDRQDHATTRVKTSFQTNNGTHQVAHIYMDATYTYTGHALYPNVKND
ncbi:hypothetical protein QBC46DRAFT_457538 [Diplogelasinospora grovesii]|uniref:Uncharacterized protein n=1 Tax=Diplogelasinospora grovesii TaxID=303347 RepID=A0AAN6S765_9PEZI|nr:hypothetical protein QBC46DRAFT_457538 [Diplogelasinospora grovesii]